MSYSTVSFRFFCASLKTSFRGGNISHVDVWQKATQYCEAIMLQLKINFKKKGLSLSNIINRCIQCFLIDCATFTTESGKAIFDPVCIFSQDYKSLQFIALILFLFLTSCDAFFLYQFRDTNPAMCPFLYILHYIRLGTLKATCLFLPDNC